MDTLGGMDWSTINPRNPWGRPRRRRIFFYQKEINRNRSHSLSPSVFVWQRSVFSKASAVTQTFGRHWRLPGEAEAEAGVRVEEGNVQCSLLPVLLTAAAAAPGGSKTSIQNRDTRTLHACIVTPSINSIAITTVYTTLYTQEDFDHAKYEELQQEDFVSADEWRRPVLWL